jgi:hypothetical protein
LGFAFFVDGTGLEQIKFRLSPDISGKYGAIVTAEARFFRQEDQTQMASLIFMNPFIASRILHNLIAPFRPNPKDKYHNNPKVTPKKPRRTPNVSVGLPNLRPMPRNARHVKKRISRVP